MDYNFFMPTRLFTGENCLLQYSEPLTRLGKRCMVITGDSSAKTSGALTDLRAVLERQKIAYTVFNQVEQNPTFLSCLEGAHLAQEFAPDFLVGIGGGSPLDATKAIALLSKNLFSGEEDFFAEPLSSALPFALIGTSAGSGSEVTDVSVITASSGRKKSIHNPLLYAKVSYCDPRYTYSLSETFTISSSIDALSHSLESYFSKASNEISEIFALKALSILYPTLSLMKRFGFQILDHLHREELQQAAIYAGMAINLSGTCFPHSLGYFLTEKYDLPHGLACGIFLPSFVEWCGSKSSEKKIRVLLKTLDIDSLLPLQELIQYFTSITLTISHDDIREMVTRTSSTRGVINTPGNFGQDSLFQLLNTLFPQNGD